MIWDWFLLTPYVCSIMNLILCSFPGKYSIFFFESIAAARVAPNKWLIYNNFRAYFEACPALHELIQCCWKKIKKVAQMISIESKRLPSFILSVVRNSIISRNCKFSLLRKLSEHDCHKLAGCLWTFRKSALNRHNIRPHRQRRTWFRN